jgi:hypothetical protein
MVPTGFFIIRQPSATLPTEPATGDPEYAGVELEK